MQLQVDTKDQVTVIDIVGDITWETCDELQTQFNDQIQEGGKILLDMEHVATMSSAGFRMLLSTYREVQARHGELVLARLSESLQELMAYTGFLQYFQIRPTLEEGMQALQEE